MSDWRGKEAINETIFREMNEWTDRGCTEPIRLTRLEYESIRAEPLRFAVALNHESPEIDRIVEENERFATVDKFHGGPRRIARETNPRR